MRKLIILPLLLLVAAPLAAQTTLQVTGGMNLATLSVSVTQELGADPETNSDDAGIELSVGSDFGVGGMAGFDVSLTDRLGLTAGAGYAFGFADLDESSGSARHRVFSFRAGITYSPGSM